MWIDDYLWERVVQGNLEPDVRWELAVITDPEEELIKEVRNIQDESKTDFKGRDDSPSRERVQPTTVGKAKTNIRKKTPVGGNKNKKKA